MMAKRKRFSSSSSVALSTPRKRGFWSELNRLIESFIRKDAYGFFQHPVDVQIVTDYLDVIKRPMDLGTMRDKVERCIYQSVEDFKEDASLVCNNARIYNRPDTIYFREASRLWSYMERCIDRCAPLIASRDAPVESRESSIEAELAVEEDEDEEVEEEMAEEKVEKMRRPLGEEEVDVVGTLMDGPTSTSGRDLLRAASATSTSSARSMVTVIDVAHMDPSDGADGLDIGGDMTPIKKPAYHNIRRRKYVDAPFRTLADGSFKEVEHQQWLDDLPDYGLPPQLQLATSNGKYSESISRPAGTLDYGPYGTLAAKNPPPSADRAMYLFSTFGDEIGEAYARSLEAFTRDMPDDVKLAVHARLNRLSEGAHAIVHQVVRIACQPAQQATDTSVAVKTEDPNPHCAV